MTKEQVVLGRSARGRVLAKYFGKLFLVLAALVALPLVVSLRFREFSISLRYGIVVALLLVFGALLSRRAAPQRLQTNEAMVIGAGMFILAPILMTIPMMGAGLGFVDALFEAVSAVTTTGLSTVTGLQERPATFLFARAWMQWYGGLGIVVLSLALVVRSGVLARRLAVVETYEDDLVGGTKAHARRALLVYAVLTGVAILGLWLLGADAFSAVLYSLAAVSTGGFAPHDDSLAQLPTWALQAATVLFCAGGAVSLVLYRRTFRGRLREFVRDPQVRALVVIGAAATTALTASLHYFGGASWSEALHHGPLIAMSAQTTAGFTTENLAEVHTSSKLVLIASMLIGGGAGSTAGGIKLLRILILARVLQAILVRTSMPRRAVFEPRLGGHRIEPVEVQQALIILALHLAVVIVSWFVFLAVGYDAVNSLFEVVSATATVGLSTGLVRPELPGALKLLLCLDMLMGRLEIIPLLVLIYPGTWLSGGVLHRYWHRVRGRHGLLRRRLHSARTDADLTPKSEG